MSVSKNGNRYFNEEELQKAQDNNNALDYAESRGYDLIREGNYYKMKEHDSLVFSPKGYFAWNSHGIQGGGAIDFMVEYEGMSKVDAILTLAGTLDSPPPVGEIKHYDRTPEKEKPFILPERAAGQKQVYVYLTHSRGIDARLVKGMLNQHTVYQGQTYSRLNIAGYGPDGQALYQLKHPDEPADAWLKDHLMTGSVVSWDGRHPLAEPIEGVFIPAQTARELAAKHKIYSFSNLVMVGYDKNKIARYASLRSVTGKKFRMDVPGSSKSTPFTINGNKDSDTVCTFESPVEAMSYWSLCKEFGSKRLNCPMVSQGGANTFAALETYLREHPGIKNIVACLNNDSDELRGRGGGANTGQICMERLQKQFGETYTVTTHTPHLNDWNDVLRSYREMSPEHTQERKRQAPQKKTELHR